MFVVIVYDVPSKKDPKVLKILRRYCFRIQNSVFEGELTTAQLKKLKQELTDLQLQEEDCSILIYSTLTSKSIKKEAVYGKSEINVILG